MKSVRKLVFVGLTLAFLLVTAVPVFGAPAKVRVFVGFAPGNKAATHSALQQAGAEFHYTFDDLNSFVVTGPSQALKGLSQNPNIVDIEEDAQRYPIRDMASSSVLAPLADTSDPNGDIVPYGVDSVQARAVWDANNDGSFDAGAPAGQGVKVCILWGSHTPAQPNWMALIPLTVMVTAPMLLGQSQPRIMAWA